jgi:hypothetical protein
MFICNSGFFSGIGKIGDLGNSSPLTMSTLFCLSFSLTSLDKPFLEPAATIFLDV